LKPRLEPCWLRERANTLAGLPQELVSPFVPALQAPQEAPLKRPEASQLARHIWCKRLDLRPAAIRNSYKTQPCSFSFGVGFLT
jgi:hypothetical protein